MLCRLPGTKAKRKHPQGNESHRTSHAEALTGFGHHFKRVDFLRMPLPLPIYFPISGSSDKAGRNTSESPGLAMVETAHSPH